MKKQGSILRKTVMSTAIILALFSSAAKAQLSGGSSYPGGILEYSLPYLTSVPPLTDSQPPDVVTAYLWADELMRTTQMYKINNWISNLSYSDTMKTLAQTLYEVDDDNPLSLYQWEISGWPLAGHPDYTWHYKADPGVVRPSLQNQIGSTCPDTGRTGFLLACDYISDITVGDTSILYHTGSSIPHMVLVNATINDQIKGQRIPACPSMMKERHKGATPQDGGYSTYAVNADTGSCMQFEYSPEWQRGLFTDDLRPFDEDYTDYLADSTGFWIKPGGEYIVLLYVHGVNGDTANGYFTIDPFWGVFGTQGAMYRVIDGYVVDPYDDFGLGGTHLTVSVWKTRLRARIYNILHP